MLPLRITAGEPMVRDDGRGRKGAACPDSSAMHGPMTRSFSMEARLAIRLHRQNRMFCAYRPDRFHIDDVEETRLCLSEYQLIRCIQVGRSRSRLQGGSIGEAVAQV